MKNQRTPKTDYATQRERAVASLAKIQETLVSLDARMNALDEDGKPLSKGWVIAGQMECLARLLGEAAGE